MARPFWSLRIIRKDIYLIQGIKRRKVSHFKYLHYRKQTNVFKEDQSRQFQSSDTNSSNGKKVAEIESILAGVVNAYAELRKGESGAGSSSDEEEVKDHV